MVVAAALVVALVITGRLLNVPSSPAPVRPAPSSDLPYRISGRGDLQRRLVLAVAAHLEMVPPGR